jgi:hypothetical protein
MARIRRPPRRGVVSHFLFDSFRIVRGASAMSYQCKNFYIDGKWVTPALPREFEVINPATEQPAGVISMGSAADVECAVSAA